MKTTAKQFEQWKSALDSFQKNVEKSLKEIRQQKIEVEQIKASLLNCLDKGYYLRDENRIVISAPEIIIGNVDRNGILQGSDGSTSIILRSNNIGLEGIGTTDADVGRIITRASQIHQIAVDPGIDGLENVVKERSEVVAQARNIQLQSDSALGHFPSTISIPTDNAGIRLSADKDIDIKATLPCQSQKESLDNQKKTLDTDANNLKSQVGKTKTHVETLLKELNKMVNQDQLNADEVSTRTNMLDIDQLYEDFNSLTSALYEGMTGYFHSLSLLAETNRKISCIEEQGKQLDKIKGAYKDKSTGTSVAIQSEHISLVSIDGDGNLRTNPGAGFSVTAHDINMNAYTNDGSLMKESQTTITTEKVSISTANPKISKDQTDYPAIGKIGLLSKEITLEAVDYQLKDKKTEEKALTKEGAITLRAETIKASAYDTEGKATGKIAINAKKMEFKSMDVDKEKKTDKSLAADSSMLMLSDKIYVGSKDKKTKSKNVQIASDKIAALGTTTVELQQGDAKGIVQLNGGDTSLSGSKLNLYGTTTVEGKASFQSDVSAGKAEIKNLEIKSSFKSPYTTEGIAVPSAPSSAKLTAKLKEEELKSDGNK